MIRNISDPRLALKATPPKASSSLLYRERLGLNRGNQADRFVIALQAPAGYGKTSLLLQWRREALEAGAIVAWLTLDEHDDAASLAQGLAQCPRSCAKRQDFSVNLVFCCSSLGHLWPYRCQNGERCCE
jgi:LuxR family maltose regulon positive regulatory protein